jgi:LysM repeat protein
LRASTLRALTGSALTVGLLSFGATAAVAAETHEVEAGDTLADIARSNGIDTWRTVFEANEHKLDDPNLIFPGQQLRLSGEAPTAATPAADGTYTVQAGDTLAAIARANGLDWGTLYELNADQLTSPSLIFPGQALQLTGTVPASTDTTTETTDTTAATTDSTTETADAAETTADTSSETTTTSSDPVEPQGTVSLATWDRLAECESNGDWSINTGNGYYGGLQFALSSWEWVGGSGYPHEATKAEQIARAEILLERQGWNAWPACSSALGLR